jgi:hypothetical protein
VVDEIGIFGKRGLRRRKGTRGRWPPPQKICINVRRRLIKPYKVNLSYVTTISVETDSPIVSFVQN